MDREANVTNLSDWVKAHNVDEVECLLPDMSGIARGKILPSNKFLKSLEDRSLRVPECLFIQTVTGRHQPRHRHGAGSQHHSSGSLVS